tara:strand:- start:89 stop:331 length:243 start_codon:yes stop_codon:yes gene_type:complete
MFDPRIYTETLISTCELKLEMWKSVYEMLGTDFECRTPSQQELHIYECILIKKMQDEFKAEEAEKLAKNIAKTYNKKVDK